MRLSRRGALKMMPAAAAGTVLSGCGLSSGSSVPVRGSPGSNQPVPGPEGGTVTVGSQDLTEQMPLGYQPQFALAAAVADVRALSHLIGSSSARNALANGQIDVLWEYTGSSWISYNDNTDPIPDPKAEYEAVREQDLQRHGIAWTAINFNVDNTYAFAVNQQNEEQLGVSKLSDIRRVIAERPELATFCVDSEFAS